MAGSEFPNSQPDVDGVRHGTEGTAHPQVEPGTGIKDDGYPVKPPAASGHVQPGQNENFVRRRYYDLLKYLTGLGVREFDSIRTALANVSAPESFRLRTVDPSTGDLKARSTLRINLQGVQSAVAIDAMATDGDLLFYAQDNDVYAVDPDTGDDGAGGGQGTFIWTQSFSSAVKSLAADGNFVYVGTALAVGDDLRTLNRLTGAVIDGEPTVDSLVSIDANGKRVVGVGGDGNNSFQSWSVSGAGVLTSDGVVDYDADLLAVALDADEFAWCGGVQDSGGADLHGIDLTGAPSETRSITLPTTGPATVRAICTDGNYIYVAIDQETVIETEAKTARVFCLQRDSGAVNWFSDELPADPTACCIDQAFLYVSTASAMFALDKSSGRKVWQFGASFVGLVCDGAGIFGTSASPFDTIKRVPNGLPTIDMQALNGGDVGRRPFFNLAVPRHELVRTHEIPDRPLFGRGFASFSDLTEYSTTSATYVEATTWTTPVLEAGDYVISYGYNWRQSLTTEDAQIKVEIDDTTIVRELIEEPTESVRTQKHIAGAVSRPFTLTGGTHQIDVDIAAPTGGTTFVSNIELLIWRVS